MSEKYSTTTLINPINNKSCLLDPDLETVLSQSRDYNELLWAWLGWHNNAGRAVREEFSEMVQLLNKCAQENGYKDAGEVWKVADYDDPSIESSMDALMTQMMPLYRKIHAFVRKRLYDFYVRTNNSNGKFTAGIQGDITKFEPDGYIPAHVLGNMFSQQWSNIFDLVLPFPGAPPPINVTSVMKKKNFTVHKMFKVAEEFFTSMGFQPMTAIFWKESVVQRPADPNVKMVCHASAFDMVRKDDYRIKMCTKVEVADLLTIHHEMGHVEYYMEYRHLPIIFANGGNAAFHEAVGDTIGLSMMTTKHLRSVGLYIDDAAKLKQQLQKYETNTQEDEDEVNFVEGEDDGYESTYPNLPDGEEGDLAEDVRYTATDINDLMRMALEKIVFLPYAYTLEKWRFRVFRGEVTPGQYNDDWWKLRRKYQGVDAPLVRGATDFDPGAKYHVAANIPYNRYFFSFIGQFQFYESLCREARELGPLHKCDFYRSRRAGRKLRRMLKKGNSVPWRALMRELTGQSDFKTSSILKYFKPLSDWLDENIKDVPIGWPSDDE
ncbi:hypothetical protein HELRODRAFT_98522 [Helobdella robusta]|uniref:Angiotensin-converting enzyme n=1 Tax=Helobdella robusta TaxID=6412 RepID=T1G9N4_HELRO|nr:hypothetical protein HELRODRAFT_98522 [Helobdella robusta]ESO07108.1 hypothetical protein HELRODRAFT_98522 [Helobdella robusta]